MAARSCGYPAFKVAGKFFTRLRSEDDSLVMGVSSIDERDMLLEADPDVFHLTDHYKNYPYVLVRIGQIDSKTLRGMLERQWRRTAPKKLVAELTPSAVLSGERREAARGTAAQVSKQKKR